MNTWALTADALREPWRLWTGHLAHYSVEHLVLNVIAALPPVMLLSARDRRIALFWGALAAPAISVAILMTRFGTEYRGLSALVVGLWFLAPILRRRPSWIARIMLLAAIAKLTVEMTWPINVIGLEAAPLPFAHLAGAVAGAAWAIVLRFRSTEAHDSVRISPITATTARRPVPRIAPALG